MSKVSVSQVYNVSPARVWQVVGAPGEFAAWHPAVAKSEMEGSLRHCLLADGGLLDEEILAHSDDERSYSYRIIEGPLPVAGYVSKISVVPEGEGARLSWEAEFEAAGAPEETVEGLIRGLYEAGLGSVAAGLT